ncbi:hypothetical protein SeMB42_g06931 [Synchytrium endobioticum]|uniref:Tyrosine-protein phosphatase domain-containing protein n=1 Tax=Synchytrium endobioticum TaxID=286115 RepID=A0A507CH54_9FUNG|nr:hypothetical protein SeMB42_g06931 [Synchytrium endobioticum]TPX43600.1 hypothetical protein SeLEV6574_g04962 [Synchytrium endobioticum]
MGSDQSKSTSTTSHIRRQSASFANASTGAITTNTANISSDSPTPSPTTANLPDSSKSPSKRASSKRFSRASISSFKTPSATTNVDKQTTPSNPGAPRLGSLEFDSEQAIALQGVIAQRNSTEETALGVAADNNNASHTLAHSNSAGAAAKNFIPAHKRSNSSNSNHSTRVAPIHPPSPPPAQSSTTSTLSTGSNTNTHSVASDRGHTITCLPHKTLLDAVDSHSPPATRPGSLATSPVNLSLLAHQNNSSNASLYNCISNTSSSESLPDFLRFPKKNSLASRRSSTASGHQNKVISRNSSLSNTSPDTSLQPPRLNILPTKTAKKATKETPAPSIIAANEPVAQQIPANTETNITEPRSGLLSHLLPSSAASSKPSAITASSTSPMSRGVGSHIPALVASLDPSKLPPWLSRLSSLSARDATKLLTSAFAEVEHEERERINEAVQFNTTRHISGNADNGHPYAFWAACTAPNSRRNRYTDILPYDGNRFRLAFATPSPAGASSDYINASTVIPLYSDHVYIATQGPLANTIGDFWRMVWDSGSRMIVMLTTLEERGRVKCARYWPEQLGTLLRLAEVGGLDLEYTAELNFNEILPRLPSGTKPAPASQPLAHQPTILSFSSAKQKSDVAATSSLPPASLEEDLKGCVRVFRLTGPRSKSNNDMLETRRIYQVHFTGWPDHRAASPEAVLKVREIVNMIESEERQAALGRPLDTGSVAALVNWEEVVVDSTAKQPIIKRFSHRRAQSSTSTLDAVPGNSINNVSHSSSSSTSNNRHQNSQLINTTPSTPPSLTATPSSSVSSLNNSDVVATGTKLHCNISYATPIGPTVVHCSAGCGRTGTYIAIDSILSAWKEVNEHKIHHSSSDYLNDPVVETLRKLREQRVSMVQTLEQFALCHEAILAALASGRV